MSVIRLNGAPKPNTYRECLVWAVGAYATALRKNNGYLRPIEEQIIIDQLGARLKASHYENANPEPKDRA